MSEKRTTRHTIWMPEQLEIDLMRLAAGEDRKFGDFITHVLLTYAYGHRRCECPTRNVANGGDARNE